MQVPAIGQLARYLSGRRPAGHVIAPFAPAGRLRISPAIPLLAPATLLLFVLGIYPLLYAFWVSLHTMVLTRPSLGRGFVGLGNYADVLRDPLFWASLRKTGLYALMTLPIQTVGGILVALLLHVDMGRFRRWQRTLRLIMIVPLMMTPAAVGLMGRLIFNREFGVLNYFLGLVGVGKVNWIGDPAVAPITVALVDIWQWTPFVALVVLAGLTTIPQELYEAAVLDSAAGFPLFRDVLLPYLRPGLTAVLIIRSADIVRSFDAIFTLTRGGPGVSTELVSLYVQRVGFRIYDLGHATAMAFLLLVLTIVMANLFIRYFYRDVEAEG